MTETVTGVHVRTQPLPLWLLAQLNTERTSIEGGQKLAEANEIGFESEFCEVIPEQALERFEVRADGPDQANDQLTVRIIEIDGQIRNGDIFTTSAGLFPLHE